MALVLVCLLTVRLQSAAVHELLHKQPGHLGAVGGSHLAAFMLVGAACEPELQEQKKSKLFHFSQPFFSMDLPNAGWVCPYWQNIVPGIRTSGFSSWFSFSLWCLCASVSLVQHVAKNTINVFPCFKVYFPRLYLQAQYCSSIFVTWEITNKPK